MSSLSNRIQTLKERSQSIADILSTWVKAPLIALQVPRRAQLALGNSSGGGTASTASPAGDGGGGDGLAGSVGTPSHGRSALNRVVDTHDEDDGDNWSE